MMKSYLAIAIAVLVGSVVIFMASAKKEADASPVTVRQYIEDIPKVYGIARTDGRITEGYAVLGGNIEKGVRRFLRIPTREKPVQIREYLFELPDGGLVVSFHEVQQQVTQIVLVANDFDTSPVKDVSRSLRKLVPNADFTEITSRIKGDSRWRKGSK